ncbi:GNAT family N-acetyltransferase [Enterococcus ureilyticus]|uniref:GNAT family N-acetyltransferase n=1 Tax=Enterococcus ureilyticus TaxID=1131292 RepID=UPI001A9172CB|nr:GNAT family N-acetyltransferase [Enterococcus ureilyticus]MBO0446785.1 GNAT family N-acetyltransferase [Enterococcus ureilyticus]
MYLTMYEDTHETLIHNYCLSEKKMRYVREPKIATALIKKDPLRHAILAFEGDYLVAFLTLYEANGGSFYSTNKNCLLVQDLSTDYRHLRNGYVQQAVQLLPTFVRQQFPTIDELMIIVNEDQAFTKVLCKEAGFQNIYSELPDIYGSQVFLQILL